MPKRPRRSIISPFLHKGHMTPVIFFSFPSLSSFMNLQIHARLLCQSGLYADDCTLTRKTRDAVRKQDTCRKEKKMCIKRRTTNSWLVRVKLRPSRIMRERFWKNRKFRKNSWLFLSVFPPRSRSAQQRRERHHSRARILQARTGHIVRGQPPAVCRFARRYYQAC